MGSRTHEHLTDAESPELRSVVPLPLPEQWWIRCDGLCPWCVGFKWSVSTNSHGFLRFWYLRRTREPRTIHGGSVLLRVTSVAQV